MNGYVRNTIAFLIGLAVPLSAYAQQTIPQRQPAPGMQITPQQQPQTTAPLQQAPMQAAQAVLTQPTYSSGEIIVGQDVPTSQLPQLTLGLGDSRVTVVNPRPNSIWFSSPTIGLNQEVPANSQRTIWITSEMVSNLAPGQQVAYYINDMQGNIIASSSFQVNTNTMLAMTPAPILVTETKKETYTYTTTRETKPASRRSTVRGYW